MNILHVGTADIGGGAEKVAWNLARGQRALGHRSWLAVGRQRSGDPHVVPIPNEPRGRWARWCQDRSRALEAGEGATPVASMLATTISRAAEPVRSWRRFRGLEDFDYPGTWSLLTLTPQPADVVHLHNLHGGYFDLRALAWISRQLPVVVTLHDCWFLSGHCAQPFACERWRHGCGACPNLGTYPSVRRDATARNWRRKRLIYRKSRLFVAAPSRWLIERAQESMLAPAIVDSRVIHNGVDLSAFHPADRQRGRAELGLPADTQVLLCAATNIRRNDSKDYATMRAAIAQISATRERPLVVIELGTAGPTEYVGRTEIRCIPFCSDAVTVARYFQTADLFIHAARAESWGLSITEALACGTPAVATDVGGIPEQISSLDVRTNGALDGRVHHRDEATGVLVPPGNPAAMADAIRLLLDDDALRATLGVNAASQAARRFPLSGQVNHYLRWYDEVVDRWHAEREQMTQSAATRH